MPLRFLRNRVRVFLALDLESSFELPPGLAKGTYDPPNELFSFSP